MIKIEDLKVDEHFRDLWNRQTTEISDKTIRIIDAIYYRLIQKKNKRD